MAHNHDNESIMGRHGAEWAQRYWHGDECPDELCLQHGAVPGDWEYRSTSFSMDEEWAFSGSYDAASVSMSSGRLFFYVDRGSSLEAELIKNGLRRTRTADDTSTLTGPANRRIAHRYQRLLQTHISAPAPAP